LNRYESRICTFVVPGDWVVEPPYAFREPGEEGDRMGAQILERTLAEMPSAAAFAREQKPILAELYESFELLQEGAQRLEGPGEGYSLSFRYIDEEENPSRGKMIFFTCGPLVCQLFISGPEGEDRERDRLFESIAKTFAFQGAESLAGAKAGGLTSETLRMPQAEAAKGWPGPWRKFPRCCVELPLPTGWEVTVDERDDVVFRRGSAEIRLHRELGENAEADVWFTDRMRRLQEEGDRLLGSEQGEIERGAYSAVFYEEKGAVRTWKTAAVLRGVDLFLGDQQPLVWTLRAPELGLIDLRPFFESLIAAARFLEPSDWETRLVEPWLVGYILRGPWRAEGSGLYANLYGLPVFVQLGLEQIAFSIEKLQPSLLESIRQGFDLENGAERVTAGAWHQYEALHYAVDGSDSDLEVEVSVRAVWLMRQGHLFSILVRSFAPEAAEPLALGLLEAFQPLSIGQS
jgi:hypothetical protein